MEFPMINEHFNGIHNRYAYAQVVDSIASSECAVTKYGGLAKLHLERESTKLEKDSEGQIKMEYHQLEKKQFCTGASFVSKPGGSDEDDGWIISFVHNEDTNISQVHIMDCKRFESDAIVKITIPRRVPYGFHGTFFSKPSSQHDTKK